MTNIGLNIIVRIGKVWETSRETMDRQSSQEKDQISKPEHTLDRTSKHMGAHSGTQSDGECQFVLPGASYL